MFFSDFAPPPQDWEASKLQIEQTWHPGRSSRRDLSLDENPTKMFERKTGTKLVHNDIIQVHYQYHVHLRHQCEKQVGMSHQMCRKTSFILSNTQFLRPPSPPLVNNGIPFPLLIALFHGLERQITSKVSPYLFQSIIGL